MGDFCLMEGRMKMISYEQFQITEDHCYNIQRALHFCKRNHVDTLVFPKGEYHLYPEKAAVYPISVSNHDICEYTSIAFFLKDMENFTIDGGGSTFVSHGVMFGAALLNCSNITMKNMNFTAKETMCMEAVVLEASGSRWTVEVTNDAGFYVNNGRLWLTDGYGHSDPYSFTTIVGKDDKKGYIPESKESFERNVTFRQLEGRRLEVRHPRLCPEKGMRLVMAAGVRHGCTVFLEQSRDTVLEQVGIEHSYGMGIIAQLCHNVSIRGLTVKCEDALYSSNADATHFVSCTGKIEVTDSYFEGMLDDALNVHGIFTRIEQVEEDGILVRDLHPGAKGLRQYKAEDRIAVMNPKKLVPEQFYTITEVEMINLDYFYLHLQEPTDAIREGNTVENLSVQPEVIFNRNIVKENRARGILLASRGRTVISENMFHTPGCAILFESDGEGWYESGGTEDVLIENNIFDHCGYAKDTWENAVIELKPRKEHDGIHYYHQSVRMKNNHFTGNERLILLASDAREVVFAGNKIEGSDKVSHYQNCGEIVEENEIR